MKVLMAFLFYYNRRPQSKCLTMLIDDITTNDITNVKLRKILRSNLHLTVTHLCPSPDHLTII